MLPQPINLHHSQGCAFQEVKMVVHDGDAHTFLHYFHAHQTEMFAAILFLSVRASDQRVVEDIAEAVIEFDEALGEGIGLFLFGPKFDTTLMDEGNVVAGRRFDWPREQSGQSQRATEFFTNRDPSGYGHLYESQIRKSVARSTAAIAPQFCEIFQIDKSRLPVICAVVRGSSDAIVVPYKGALDLRGLMGAVREINNRIDDLRGRSVLAIDGIESAKRRLDDAAKWEVDIKRNEVRLIAFSTELEAELGIVISPQITALVRTGEASDERIEELLLQLPPECIEALRHDNRFKGMKSCLAMIKKLNGKFSDTASHEAIGGLSQNECFLRAMSGEITKEITAVLREFGYSGDALRMGLFRLAPWAERAIKFAETGQNISRILGESGYGRRILDALRSAGHLP